MKSLSEDPHWLYCKSTNVKLCPSFYEDRSMYITILSVIKKRLLRLQMNEVNQVMMGINMWIDIVVM